MYRVVKSSHYIYYYLVVITQYNMKSEPKIQFYKF